MKKIKKLTTMVATSAVIASTVAAPMATVVHADEKGQDPAEEKQAGSKAKASNLKEAKSDLDSAKAASKKTSEAEKKSKRKL